MGTAVATGPEQIVADAIGEALGPVPVILIGSRATGEADEASDYDLLVVMPVLRIPFLLRRMNLTAKRLEAELGARVSINPLPRFRLRRPGRSLLPWKVRREGKILSSPSGFTLGAAEPAKVTTEMSSSYATSAIHYLIEQLQPAELSLPSVPPHLQRAVRKALLHAAQLRLLRTGRYAPTLDEALGMLEPADARELGRVARMCDRPDAWFATLDLLIGEIDEEPPTRMRALAANVQYAALSALRGRSFRAKAFAEERPIGDRLRRSVVLLAGSIRPGGTVDPGGVSSAVAALPNFLRPSCEISWTAVRDLIEREWAKATPLVGL